MRTTRFAVVAAAAAVTSLTIGLAPAMAGPEAEELCGTGDMATVEDGRYVVQNNVWGAETAQCITVDGASFEVTTAEHDNATDGGPAAYPSIYAGCHYGNCTSDSGLPLAVADMSSVTSSWSTHRPEEGTYNIAYDLWFDPDADQDGQNAAELMIWNGHQGEVQPIGAQTGTAEIDGATYDVYQGDVGWNVISYVRTEQTDSVNDLDLKAFSDDAVEQGSVEDSWYLTSVQAGFEPWKGGAGLGTDSFSLDVG